MGRSQIARSLAPAIGGFLAYGTWAFFCNLNHGQAMGVQSGLVQGSLSFTITLVSNFVMESIYRFCQNRFLAIIMTSLLIIGTSYSVNWLVGTPEILMTIAPGSIFGTIYVFTYVSALHKLRGSSQ